jgi:hypothetical protein
LVLIPTPLTKQNKVASDAFAFNKQTSPFGLCSFFGISAISGEANDNQPKGRERFIF